MKRLAVLGGLLVACWMASVSMAAAQVTTAVMTYPANGATAADLSQPIQWTTVAGAQAYYLYVGTTPGAKDLVNSGEIHQTSYSATSLTPGLTVYARVSTKVGGVWRYTDSSFTSLPVARLTTPLNGAVNVDATKPLVWPAVVGAQSYYLYLGTTVGAKDLVNTGEITQTTCTIANPPVGQTVYARLWTKVGGVWRYADSSYTTVPSAVITYPTNNAAAADLSRPIVWTPVPSAQSYYLYVGTVAGAKDLVNTGEITQTSYRFAVPPGATTVYTRLWTKANSVWRYTDATFTTLAVATLAAPVNGGVADLSQPIQWSAVPGAQSYYLYIGSTVGAKDLLNTGEMQTTSFAWQRPPAGQTVYARLWTRVASVWRYTDSSFRYPAGAVLTSPANGATGADMSQPISWGAVASAQTYQLYLGSSVGAKDLADSGEITRTTYSAAVWTARTVYARLFTKINGVRLYTDSVFTTVGLAPTFTNPPPGVSRITLHRPITWTAVPGAQAYYLYIGTTQGAKNIVNTGEIPWQSFQGVQLPYNTPLFARVWAKVSGVWRYTDANFTVDPLVFNTNLVYQGSFRVPAGLHAGGQANAGFDYGGTAIAYNPAHDSIFMVGHPWDQFLAELSIPPLFTTPATWATATILQPLVDPLERMIGLINPGDPNSKLIGGVLPWQGRLVVSAYSYYDGLGTQTTSHFVRPQNLAQTGQVTGPYKVGPLTTGFTSGYFGLVPADWQAALGGPVLNGNCCLGVISRTSYGPAVFTIDPADLGAKDPVPANALVAYPAAYPLLEAGATGDGWSNTSTLFNGSTVITGVVFPEHTASVLFFGRQGLGAFCYGPGTVDQSLAGTLADGGIDRYCYDPDSNSKGVHAYPYSEYVWAYDATDLALVRSGALQPWEVRPYATWRLTLPNKSGSTVFGATYDPATGRLFVSQAYADGGVLPIVHVFTFNVP